MLYIKNICLGFALLFFVYTLKAQTNGVTKSNPFTIKGSVGASANFYHSNETFYSQPSFSWNVNGNFVAKINAVTLPFSFIANQYGKSNQGVYFQFGISPTYKWTILHLGYRYIPFSPLTFSGQNFQGIGIELNPKLFRFAAFYGKLNKAFNEDTVQGRFRLPQYSRKGYGFKVGVGSSSNYLDLIYFHAKDDSSSASVINKNLVNAQENAVLGSSFRLATLKKRMVLTGDIALSGLIPDLSPNTNSLDSSNKGLKKLMNNFLPSNKNILASYAAQSSISYYSPKYNGSFNYRRIQPNFKSLGTPYLLNDIELVTLNNNCTFVKGKINISTTLSQQHNNLNNELPIELRTQIENINVNTIITQHLTVNANYSGYNLKQKNGNPNLPDSLRLSDTLFLKQYISQLNLSPSYYISNNNLLHYISGNFSLQSLKDKNPTTAPHSNSTNLSASTNYTLSLLKKSLSFSVNYLLSHYKQEANSYSSNGFTIGTSSQLLKNKNLNIQGNVGYYANKFSNISKQKNMSYSANISYNAKRHSLNLFANYIYTPPNNEITKAINSTFPYAVATKNFYGGISYTYSIY
jgi:hypothetical protein